MYEQTARNQLELEVLKTTSRNHIICGILLLMAFPFTLLFLISTWNFYFIVLIMTTLCLGIWFLYDGIKGYKQYKRLNKEFEPK